MTQQRRCELLFIGGSAGSFQLMLRLRSSLGAGAPPVVLVLHHAQSDTPNAPAMHESLGGVPFEQGLGLESGQVYVVPAGYHGYVERDRTLSLSVDPQVRSCRPSLDVTMCSIARVFGPKAAAIVLSGANDDGADGAAEVVHAGGKVWVQSPASAAFPTMPMSVLERVPAAVSATPAQLEAIVRTLVPHDVSMG